MTPIVSYYMAMQKIFKLDFMKLNIVSGNRDEAGSEQVGVGAVLPRPPTMDQGSESHPPVNKLTS